MTFTVLTVAKSLAEYLAPAFPGAAFYEDPNQQGTKTPCFFLQQRYSRTAPHTGGRFLRRVGLDLTYLEDYSLPDLQQLYEAAAEKLDLMMETFPYLGGAASETPAGQEAGSPSPSPAALLRTYEREWQIDADALHYKFELRVWVSLPEAFCPMEEMALQSTVTEPS